MKIVLLNTWYYPNMMGGAEYSVKLLAEGLAKSGNQVAVVCVDNKEKKISKEEYNGVTVYRLNAKDYDLYGAYSKNVSGATKIINKFHEVCNKSIQKSIRGILLRLRPDIVHINCLSGISVEVVPVINKLHIPIVITLRNYYLLYPSNHNVVNNKFINSLISGMYHSYGRAKLRNVTAAVSPSDFTLKKHEKNKFFSSTQYRVCIPNCIDTPIRVTKEAIAERINRNNNSVRFIYAGWISEDKGIRSMISAFQRLEGQNVELVLCGDGDLRGFVEEKSNEDYRIRYLGKLKKSDLDCEYRKADVAIVPSIWDEPFGRVVIEAASFGLPVIASDRGGIPEIVNTLKNGIIFHASNSMEMLDAMYKMLDGHTRSSFSRNIIEHISEYSVSNQIDSYFELYQKAINK